MERSRRSLLKLGAGVTIWTAAWLLAASAEPGDGIPSDKDLNQAARHQAQQSTSRSMPAVEEKAYKERRLGLLLPGAATGGDRAFELGEEILVGSGVRPGIAVAPDRSTHVAFVSGDGVRYRKLDGGVPGPEETVYTGQAWWPHIAVSTDNDVHVVWEKDPLAGDIWYARRVSGVWKTLRLWNNGRRAMMPRIAVDSDSRAHVVFWKDVASRLPTPRGRYLRVGLAGGEIVVEREMDLPFWNANRYGDVVVDSDNVVHLFACREDGIDHQTVSEAGTLAGAASLPKPSSIDKIVEPCSVKQGVDGVFHGVSRRSGVFPYTRTGGKPTLVIWPSGGAHSDATAVGDRAVAGRGYVVFAADDQKGRVAAIDANGQIIGPAPFANAGRQFGKGDRYGPTAAASPGGGLRIAYQDDRSDKWVVYVRSAIVAGGAAP